MRKKRRSRFTSPAIATLRRCGRVVHGSLILIFALIFLTLYSLLLTPVRADELEDLQKQINDLTRARELSEAATTPLEEILRKLDGQIKSAQRGITAAVRENERLTLELDERETALAVQYKLLAVRVRSFYMRQQFFSPLLLFLSSQSASDLTRELGYQQAAADQDKRVIASIASEAHQLEEDQRAQEDRRATLERLQAQLDKEATFFRKEIKGAKEYQAALTSKIAELSARQREILAEKSGTFQTTVGDVPLADDPASRPDYNPGFSPAFAAFSFGAPHFKGMSQYGAFGRAKNGQSAEDILKAYYGGGIEIKKDYSTNVNITVSGYGTVDLETYVKRIYEMPGSWGDEGGMEALKAQAVAARSYGLAYTGNGSRPICATEHCQVYKPANKGGKWDEAVNATTGWVLVAGGQPFSAWYASTSGGYQESYSAQGHSTPGFWDTKNGRIGWTSEAYEKLADSPWFYKAWYRSRSGDNCGRNHPWLTAEELADVLNAWAVLIKSGKSNDRVTPTGTCWGGNPYSIAELRSESGSEGGGFGVVHDASVTYAENGITALVTFDTDRGSITMAGADFKKAFNLRAPGRVSLKSGLFNIEKK